MAVATILIGATVGAAVGAAASAISFGIATALGTAAVGATLAGALVSGAIYGGVAGLLGGVALALAPKPKLGGFDISGGSVQTIKVPPGAAAYAFGMCQLDGQVAFVETDDKIIHMAIALSEHSLDDILSVTADGRDITYTKSTKMTGAGGRVVQLAGTGKWAGAFFAEVYMDASTEALRAANGEALRRVSRVWSVEHTLPCTWAYVRCTHQEKQSDPLYAHIPQIRWRIKGIRCTWPGQSTAVWTRNAAAIRYFYESVVIGRTVATGTFQAAYDRCDERMIGASLPTGDLPIRWALDGVAFGEYNDVARQMDMAWQGQVIWRADEWHLYPGDRRAPYKMIDHDDIMSVQQVSYTPPSERRLNRVTGGVASSVRDNFEPVDLPPMVDTSLRAMDNADKTLDLARLAFVGDTDQAGRVMRTQLYRTRGAGQHRMTLIPGVDLENYGLRKQDVVGLALPGYGAFNDRYVVDDPTINPDGSMAVVVNAELPTTYEDVSYSAYPPARQLPV